MSEDKYDAKETAEIAALAKTAENEKFMVEITVKMGNKGVLIQLTKEARDGLTYENLPEFLGERVCAAIDKLELEVIKESLNSNQTKGRP